MPRMHPPNNVNGNTGKPDRIRIRQQLRIIIADVLLETGLSLQRISRRVRPPSERVLWSWPTHSGKNTYEDQLRNLSERDFKMLYQNEWRGSEDDD